MLINYKFTTELGQKIVDGILKGYSQYSEERIRKSEELHISGGFAWTKGNYIDHHAAEEMKELGFQHLKSKAGPTWGYLQFVHDGDAKLIIIRNQKYFNEDDFAKGRTPLKGKSQEKPASYLKQLSKINTNIDFEKIKEDNQMNETEQILLDLGVESLNSSALIEEGIVSRFKEFYIVTYLIDDNFQISEINHFMPNPHNGQAVKIDDLSGYILTSGVDVDKINYSALKQLSHYDQSTPEELLEVFDIALPGKEKEE